MSDGYRKTAPLLKRMSEPSARHPKPVIKAERDTEHTPGIAALWRRLDSDLDLLSLQSYWHERACADLYVAFAPHLTPDDYWDSKWLDSERRRLRFPPAFNGMPKVLQYDRRLVLNGRVFLIEVDRGTMDIKSEAKRRGYSRDRWRKSINGKVDAYQQFSRLNPDAKYKVLFVVKHQQEKVDAKKTLDRCETSCSS